ncbi:DUF2975 domain-containing protein [Christensenellaceae bacterium OttesenSCG-928-K19]|nr:DUF2975 domain-containing protein [Christensenellaceae bacterium OttesenSCG-928-K19]
MKSKAYITAMVFNIIIIIGMFVICGLLIALPFVTGYIAGRFGPLTPSMIFFYVGGALGLWFLTLLRKLVWSVCEGNPFTQQNGRLLNQLSWPILLLMADFIFIFCFWPSISKVLCIGLLLLGFFSARVLAFLLKRAAEYREEVDLTV